MKRLARAVIVSVGLVAGACSDSSPEVPKPTGAVLSEPVQRNSESDQIWREALSVMRERMSGPGGVIVRAANRGCALWPARDPGTFTLVKRPVIYSSPVPGRPRGRLNFIPFVADASSAESRQAIVMNGPYLHVDTANNGRRLAAGDLDMVTTLPDAIGFEQEVAVVGTSDPAEGLWLRGSRDERLSETFPASDVAELGRLVTQHCS